MTTRKKKTRSTSSTFKYPMLIESGTKEYQSKKKIEVERIDARGIFRRSRVIDQTAFDKLSMKGSERVSGRDVGGNMASKILVISKARDSLRRSGQNALIAVEACLANDVKVDLASLKIGLDALVVHFRIA